ncbi:MAG TPA: transporter substrate-binding domain-containing protein, partial [Thiolinea sp.]|nr:transporter substrate-binding domain-containing protein [Thiolinea sp.]
KSYEKADQSLADVMAGTVDVVLADGEFVRTAVAGSNGELETTGPQELIGGGIGIGMRPDDTKLHEKVNAALAEIKKDGTLEALTKKYFTEKK